MKKIYYILLVITIFNCKQSKVMNPEEKFKQDSLEILGLFKKNKIYPPNKIFSYNNILSYGNIFNNNQNYLIINKDVDKEKTYYVYKNDSLNELFRYSVSGGARFLSDTIYDVNKDSYLDLLVKSRFRSNTISDFYIQTKDSKFNVPLKTYNTTLKGNELLGCLRFNSPIVKFYKFKWNGISLDTIKWVAYDSSKEQKKYFVSKKMVNFNVNDDAEYYIGLNKEEYEFLNQLPLEFKKLDSLYYE